jgi:putative intracellular protease/amidase
MPNDLQAKRIAVPTANEGVERIELTEPVKALRDAGAEVDLLAPRVARSKPSTTWTGATRSRSIARSRRRIRTTTTASSSGRRRQP